MRRLLLVFRRSKVPTQYMYRLTNSEIGWSKIIQHLISYFTIISLKKIRYSTGSQWSPSKIRVICFLLPVKVTTIAAAF